MQQVSAILCKPSGRVALKENSPLLLATPSTLVSSMDAVAAATGPRESLPKCACCDACFAAARCARSPVDSSGALLAATLGFAAAAAAAAASAAAPLHLRVARQRGVEAPDGGLGTLVATSALLLLLLVATGRAGACNGACGALGTSRGWMLARLTALRGSGGLLHNTVVRHQRMQHHAKTQDLLIAMLLHWHASHAASLINAFNQQCKAWWYVQCQMTRSTQVSSCGAHKAAVPLAGAGVRG